MRKWLIIAFIGVLFSFIAVMFWYNDWQYRLPTPVPANYAPVQVSQQIALGDTLGFSNQRPLFLHFFNPDCPCSRFNIPHFKSLVKSYGDQVNFIVVVLSDDIIPLAAEVKNRYDLTVPVVMDNGLAAKCGVYSTPQAVLLDNHEQIYYRGNYNRSRYCTNKETNYAEQALKGLIAALPTPAFTRAALTPYGCSLPTCENPTQ